MRRARRAAPLAPSRAAGWLVIALSALLLTACTAGRPAHAGGPGHQAGGAAGRARGPGAGRRAIRVVIIAGGGGFFAGGGGGQIISFGGSGSGTRPQITVGPIPPASSDQTITLPLDSYQQVATQEQDAVSAAGDQLTQQCMQAKGFSYPVAAPSGVGGVTLQSVEEDGYGVPGLAQAQTYGYAQPGPGAGSAALGPIGTFVQNLQGHAQAWTSALLGFVPGARRGTAQGPGCLQTTDTELYGPLGGDSNPDPVPGLAVQAAQWTQSDPRILAVQREWSSCMARHGLAYKTPAGAQEHNWPAKPTAAEISTAVTDVQCKAKTNLVNTWLTVEAAYQQALTAQNLAGLSRLQASFGALLRRAEALLQVLAGAGPGQPRPGRHRPAGPLPQPLPSIRSRR